MIRSSLEIPIAVCVGIGAIYFINERLVYQCLFISYKDSSTGLYGKGPADVYFVLTWATLLTFVRMILKKTIFIPLASAWLVKPEKWMRFAEQCWNLVYYIPSWSVGMVS